MTILLLLFLSGLLLQGFKVLFAHAASQVKGYLEDYNESDVKVGSGITNHINIGAMVFNEGRTVENYAFVTPSTEGSNRLKRVIYSDSVIAERSSSDLLSSETFMQPVF